MELRKENGRAKILECSCQCVIGLINHCSHAASALAMISTQITRTSTSTIWKNPKLSWAEENPRPIAELIPQRKEARDWANDRVLEAFKRGMAEVPVTVNMHEMLKPKITIFPARTCFVWNWNVPVLLEKFLASKAAAEENDYDSPSLESIFSVDEYTSSMLAKFSRVDVYGRKFFTILRKGRFTASNFFTVRTFTPQRSYSCLLDILAFV